MGDTPNNTQRLADALRPFGWVCGADFWRRYHTDPWVFNLANAVDALAAKLAEVDAERDALRALICRAVDSGSWFELLQEARPTEGGQ
jgi:hypothetical protein